MWLSFFEVGFIFFVLIYGFLLAHIVPKKWYAWINIATAIGAIGYGLMSGMNFDQMGLNGSEIFKGIGLGLLLSVPIMLVIVGLAAIPLFHRTFGDQPSKHPSKRYTWFELCVRIPFGTALSEEVLFRGVLLGLISQLHPQVTSVIIAAMLFGIWHIVPTLNTLKENDSFSQLVDISKHRRWWYVGLTVLVTTIAGILFGYLRIWTGSLVTPWVVHTIINSAAIMSGFLSLHLQKRKVASSARIL